VPQVMLLHDSHLFYPEKYYSGDLFKRKFLKRIQRIGLTKDLKRIDNLLLQTNTAAQRVRSFYHYEGNITVIPNAVSKKVDSSAVYEIPQAYQDYRATFKLFYLTRYYPHKNIELLVKAFEYFPEKMSGFRLFLTIDGNQHPGAKKILQRIKTNQLSDQIINIGPLSQEELGGYFSHCDALVMPTTLESFSATYLEAMAFGTPIVTSKLDFAEEICQDAAIYFDPWSVESLCDALNRIKTDDHLRNGMVGKCESRLKALEWSWEKNGYRIAELINGILKHR
jgi:glycosyltransferase involved in cell wall biosynthesis